MSETEIIHITREALMMVVILAAPGLAVAMLVGLFVGIFQATTQIQEQTLAFVPKIIAVFVTLIIISGWLMKVMAGYTHQLYAQIPNIVR
ncbi:flagellar biosynthetic protein FliQ [Desulfohalotomaculum tongense]|uniref:flagellar biosynthesis protein FliQ n=1 Tax=Desulforadius tongensis TaxID=1216062 RepID=UPI00195BA41A|nr:flagellar biosynthesis protein FliQ [Desulforadius tongensis]MBM7854222.1 flagellar biosynthetic protein FliQ [Desulforadius tongensis]